MFIWEHASRNFLFTFRMDSYTNVGCNEHELRKILLGSLVTILMN